MERLKKWFDGERRKIRALPLKAKIEYIWIYYKIWLIAIAALICFAVYAGTTVHDAIGENWFYACFANTSADVGSNSAFCREFADYAGYDLRQKNLVFNAQMYCQPSKGKYNDVYYQNLVTYLDGGVLDVLVMEELEIQTLGSSGRLLDLEDPRVAAVYEKYKDRLVYCEPYRAEEYGKDQVAVGIDLSGSVLVGEHKAYPDGCVLAISSQAPHMDQIESFLAFLFREAEE